MAYVLVNWFFFLTVLWSKVKESEVTQSCLTLCNPVDYSLPGSFGHEIFQARILEWVAMLCFEFNVSRVQNALLRFTQKDKTLPNPEFVISHWTWFSSNIFYFSHGSTVCKPTEQGHWLLQCQLGSYHSSPCSLQLRSPAVLILTSNYVLKRLILLPFYLFSPSWSPHYFPPLLQYHKRLNTNWFSLKASSSIVRVILLKGTHDKGRS